MTDPLTAARPFVVIVEDDEDSALLSRASLSTHFDVQTYGQGEEALDSFRARVPDAVVLDIGMRRGMDGLQLLQAMRADPRLASVPAVALTAYAGAAMRERFLGVGFDDYVAKPLRTPEDLLHVVQRLTAARNPPA